MYTYPSYNSFFIQEAQIEQISQQNSALEEWILREPMKIT